MRKNTCGLSNAPIKKINRCRSFHLRYLELCRSKNYVPSSEIKCKNNATSVLDFVGDKVKLDDWLFVIESLRCDQILQHLSIRLRKNTTTVADHIDTKKKAQVFKQKPAVYTKYIFTEVVEAVANCIQFNKNLVVLNLEALPLNERYVVSIAKALSSNEQLRHLSFQRSTIGDKGCEAICSTVKYLASIDTLNLSECSLTVHGASHIADMIKFQKICRYSDGWQKSLRYINADPNAMTGLRVILLARNPSIGDGGVDSIVEIIKEDAWIKVIDMENCGITDVGANLVLDCLELNNTVIDFNIRNNSKVSKFLQRNIREQFGKDEELSNEGDVKETSKKSKISITLLEERVKFLEEQIASEKKLRKQVELSNEKLHKMVLDYENRLIDNEDAKIPDGYVLVLKDSLDAIINQTNNFYKRESRARTNQNESELKKFIKVRRVKSEMKYKQHGASNKVSKSEYKFANHADPIEMVFEKNIGDNQQMQNCNQLTARVEENIKSPFDDNMNIDHSSGGLELPVSDVVSDELQQFNVIVRRKEDIIPPQTSKDFITSPRSMFLGRRK